LSVFAAFAASCVRGASFSAPPLDGAETWLFAFIPKNDTASQPFVVVYGKSNQMENQVFFSASSDEYEMYALLYGCDSAKLRMLPGFHDQKKKEGTKPIPDGAFGAYRSTGTQTGQTDWAAASVEEVMQALALLRIRGERVTECLYDVEIRELPNTSQFTARPLAVSLDVERVLVGIEAGPFELITENGATSVELSTTTPALAGTVVDETIWLIGSGGRVARGELGLGLTILPELMVKAPISTAALGARRDNQSIELFAATDTPGYQSFRDDQWTEEGLLQPLPGILTADIVLGANDTFYGAFMFQAYVTVFDVNRSYSRIWLPEDTECPGCESMLALAANADGSVYVSSTLGNLYAIRDGQFEALDLVLPASATALSRLAGKFLLGNARGAVHLVQDSGELCLVGEMDRVISEIVPTSFGFVAIGKDQLTNDPAAPKPTNVGVLIANEPTCTARM
jgi:hypothetical protein